MKVKITDSKGNTFICLQELQDKLKEMKVVSKPDAHLLDEFDYTEQDLDQSYNSALTEVSNYLKELE